jgi:hypothetical protein
MKIKCALSCLALLLAFSVNVSAQLIAGSPEDRLYEQISAATDPQEKIDLCLQFEDEFPESTVLGDVYTILMDTYNRGNSPSQTIEFGEKAIELDGNNVTALMTVARTLSVERQELPKAVQYAQRAVDRIEEMKAEDPPPQFTADSWQQYIESLEGPARNILSYARTVSP